MRPALDVEFTYNVLNTAPTITAPLAASDLVVDEGAEVALTVSAEDPNPLDPLVLTINGADVGYATGAGAWEHYVVLGDEGTSTFDAQVRDDEESVFAGSVGVTVLNVAPEITDVWPAHPVYVGRPFEFGATAEDPGVYDVLSYAWDLDEDGAYDDHVGADGEWSVAVAGQVTLGVEVSDDDGGVSYGVAEVEVLATEPGDLNCDGFVNFDDIDGFVLALVGIDAYYAEPAYADCEWYNADVNFDYAANFDDISPFVLLLVSN